MLIFDESNNVLTNPDLASGRLEEHKRIVVHEYVVEAEAQSHEEVIAEYPNGGKDVAIIVDVEERGHWEARLESGDLIDSDTMIPDGVPRDEPLSISEPYLLYVPLAADELEEAEREKARVESERKKTLAEAEARDAYLAQAPARTEALECGREEQMDALAELGALAANSAATLEDVLNAVAELGAMVAREGV